MQNEGIGSKILSSRTKSVDFYKFLAKLLPISYNRNAWIEPAAFTYMFQPAENH